jgi:glutathione S-transferase
VGLRLYVVPNSHPCAAVEKALQLKGLRYRVWEWPPPLHAPMQQLLFGHRTVPALRNGTEKISGSRAIMHRLDELAPEPPLYPADPELRARVEEADRWGDEEFQQVARDLIWAGAVHRPDALVSYGRDSRVPLPAPLVRAVAPAVARAGRRLNRTSDGQARRRLQELPHQIARIDGWLADGTIGDPEHPNAADLQILSTVRLLYSCADARPALEGHPALAAAHALWPPVGGELPVGALTTV